MKHTIKLQSKEKTFTNDKGNSVRYLDTYIVVDDYMIVKLEKSDNTKNLNRLLKATNSADIAISYEK